MITTFLANYTAFSATWTALGLLALWLPAGNPISRWLALIWLVGLGWQAGRRLFPREKQPWSLLLGVIIFSAAFAIIAALAYFTYRLDRPVISLVMIAVAAAFGFLRAPMTLSSGIADEKESGNPDGWQIVDRRISAALTLLALTLAVVIAGGLAQSATELAVRSPWDVAPTTTLPLIGLLALTVVALSLNGRGGVWPLLPGSALAWILVSVAALTYASGFGFDPFIHQATETAIWRDGFILPKTPYYLGQYAIVTTVAHLTKISVAACDVFLISIAFALAPIVAWWSLRRSRLVTTPLAAAVTVLILPLAPFIMTTPQGFGDALALIAAFLAFAFWSDRLSFWLPMLLSTLATLTHPIAGLPSLALLLLLAVAKTDWRTWTRRIVLAVIFVLGSLSLPTAFLFGSPATDGGATWHELPSLLQQLFLAVARPDRRFLLELDFAYLWQAWQPLTLLAFAVGGSIYLMRQGRRGISGWWLAAGLCLTNWLLLKSAVAFPFLIEYERANYADRLMDLLWLLIAPLVAVGIGWLFLKLRSVDVLTRLTVVLLLTATVTANCYLAYPRRDSYAASRGWSTGAADFTAVRQIDADAHGRPYVALANQSVSAAAIREFGFRRYYEPIGAADREPIFFYPVPTGGSLYAIFLKTNATFGAAATAREAMDLTGVDLVYLVVNDYWWDARRIVVGAKRESEGWWTVSDRVHVFRYERASGD